MELTILTSKKGTRVVKSTQLHRALGLNDNHYPTNVKRWLSDIYQFSDGIRKPAAMADYARARGTSNDLLKEYYLSIELARLISLASRSKSKQALANKLLREEEAFPQRVQLGAEELLLLLEQVKAMSRLSCQVAAEQRHLAAYTRRRGSAEYWNHYRAELIGYRKEELLLRLSAQGISPRKRQSMRELLLAFDPYESIRIGLLDYYAGQGHPASVAAQVAEIGRRLAEQLQLEVSDDRSGEQLFTTPVDASILARIRGVAA